MASKLSTEERTNRTMENKYISVAEFYHGRSIFITGGTGFMGKVLIEKLLRSCPGIKQIFILIRPKRGQDIAARLTEILGSPLFDKIRNEHPANLKKIVPIHGDITLNQLGISEIDQSTIIQEVSVVFHSAATVKFDEKIKQSVTINMIGTKQLMELCRKMLCLDALVHVSTAYCNCDRKEVSEIIYPPPYNPDDIIQLVRWFPEDILEKLTPSLIGNRPNSYTFTKAMAEHMLLMEANNLPVAIVRPSIVLSSFQEPMCGWVDNFNGPTGIVSAVSKGLFRTILCDESCIADLIPVDIVINLMIATAWHTASRTNTRNITVYNCTSGIDNPISWGTFVRLCIDNTRKHPIEGVLWYPTGNLRVNKAINFVHGALVHFVPAILLDILSLATGKKPIMQIVQTKLGKAASCLQYFTNAQWRFRNDNVKNLLTHMSPKDRSTFQFDVSTIDWKDYIEKYVLGFRKYLFKQNPATLEKCRNNMYKMYLLHQLTKVVAVAFLWRFLMKKSIRLRSLWEMIFSRIVHLVKMIAIF
ncbi:putative fatty acyl-CoA reductase CG5065 [Uranotaenia lowii]|uniref:putative fatty acyl-CoA reductase CG5065 n=1 Tax=Uranotaenia lowii TaxID=190385 RepID=UPI00247A65E6|nr:putative fatty acyl-CoA reductase CG5065 [Uranotaenia lowii]XP_055610156.1 putative fatty acyl-CoA reductase CG5065 [Uranotaenia lowii]